MRENISGGSLCNPDMGVVVDMSADAGGVDISMIDTEPRSTPGLRD